MDLKEFFLKANELKRIGEYDQAGEILGQLYAKYPMHPEIMMEVGDLNYVQGYTELAMSNYLLAMHSLATIYVKKNNCSSISESDQDKIISSGYLVMFRAGAACVKLRCQDEVEANYLNALFPGFLSNLEKFQNIALGLNVTFNDDFISMAENEGKTFMKKSLDWSNVPIKTGAHFHGLIAYYEKLCGFKEAA